MNNGTTFYLGRCELVIGEAVDELPSTAKKKLAEAEHSPRSKALHWFTVAEYGRKNPGKWFSVLIPSLHPNSLKPTAGRIRKSALVAFRSGRWDAEAIGKHIWVKYLGPKGPPAKPPAAAPKVTVRLAPVCPDCERARAAASKS